MSKRQEKIAQRIKEQKEFIQKRRKVQLAVFEQGSKLGNAFYEENKDNMSEEERTWVEEEIRVNQELLEKLRKEANAEIN